MDHPFLVEPAHGKPFTYRELLARVSDPERKNHPVIRTANPGEFFTDVLAGALRKIPLEITDGDAQPSPFTPPEPEPGPGPEANAAPSSSPLAIPLLETADLYKAIAWASDATVTLATSGSTGRPKRVTHTLAALTRPVRRHARHRDAVWGLAYNPSHMAGLQVFFQAVMNGNTLVNLVGLAPEMVSAAIRDHGITHLSATPTFYRLLSPSESPMAGVRRITFGGETLEPALMKRMRALFPGAKFLNIYASTEAGTLFVSEGERFRIPQAMADKTRIIGGELQLHRSLLGDAAETRADAWYRTGDLVELTASPSGEATFRFCGRRGTEINVGGCKINPAEIEAAVRLHPAVRDCQVRGQANSLLGSILCCDVIASRSVDERELRTFLADRLTPLKTPRLWRFVEDLKTTSTGKRPLKTP